MSATAFLLHYKLHGNALQKTQALMGATRLASGIVQLLLSGTCVSFFLFSRRETRRPH